MNQSPISSPAVTASILPRWPVLADIAAALPGIFLCGAITLLSDWLGEWRWLQQSGISTLVVAITLGMVLGNTVYPRMAHVVTPGVVFSKQKLLRLGIIFFAIHLTLQDIRAAGSAVILIDLLMVLSTFGLALLIGRFLLKMDSTTVFLIGAGSSICGAAAVLATEPIVDARAEQVTIAVSTVVVFGTLATFLYPLLYQLNQHWQLLPTSAHVFGIYAGSTIHEVAQVVAAARSFGSEGTNVAVIAKMLRVMLLPIFLLSLSVHVVRRARSLHVSGNQTNSSANATLPAVTIPWFAFIFVAMVGVNSVVTVPAEMARIISSLDATMLTIAMAALGLTTHRSAFRLAGKAPIILATVLFVWLVVGGAAINFVVPVLLG